MLRPTVEVIDLSEAWDSESQFELFLHKIKRRGVLKDNFLFRGVDGDRISELFDPDLHGDEEGCIFCYTLEEMRQNIINQLCEFHPTVLGYADDFDNPVVAVYDFSKLEKGVEYDYCLKEGVSPSEAIVAVFLLKY